ncbi:MAG: hypothetical protein OXC10_00340 [Rhodospirillaceae bacterium]|nr:hypothetical protein [Rhodospirillaceae bacterium]
MTPTPSITTVTESRSSPSASEPKSLTVGGFSPQISAVYEKRSSNAQLHDYKRFSGELRFVRLF